MNYIVKYFRETVAGRFPDMAEELDTALDERMKALWAEHSAASKDERFHLESQIIPGIAAYQVLQTVMDKNEALETVHSYVERRALKFRAVIVKLLKIPGLYRLVPVVFTKGTRRSFGESAGFRADETEVGGRVWRLDMLKCPYNDNCIKHGCPELCRCFCDSDDVTYGDLHEKLVWHRTKTLGRGGDRCDFCVRVKEETE